MIVYRNEILMQAIEFVAKVKDGVIKIPKEYIKTLHDELRVIILVEHHVAVPKKKKLTSLKVKTKDLVFERGSSLKMDTIKI